MRKVIIIAAIALVNLGGCTVQKKENPKLKNQLNLVATKRVKSLDPIEASDSFTIDEVGRVYEGLFTYDYLKRPYTLVPNLAAEMPTVSADGLEYLFKIKRGVFFHQDACFKGSKRELKAQDFVYSLKRLAAKKNASPGWWTLKNRIEGLDKWREISDQEKAYEQKISGLMATGGYTLKIKLKKPYPQLLYILEMPYTYAVARECVEYYQNEFSFHPVGTGPYRLQRYIRDHQLIYVKNNAYRALNYPDTKIKLPAIDKVTVHIMVEGQTRWLNFLAQKIDLVEIPKDNIAEALTPNQELSQNLQEKGIVLSATPSLDLTYIGFNHEWPLFKNIHLRKALSLAYNAAKANTYFYGGRAKPAQSLLPPGIAGYDPKYQNPYRKFDLDQARIHLEKAGYPAGKGLPEITFDSYSSTMGRQKAEYMVQAMKEIGITIKPIINTWPELSKKLAQKKVQLFARSWIADYPDAQNFFQILYSKNKAPGPNYSNYHDEKFDTLFLAASMESNAEKREKLYRELNHYIAEQVPMIFEVHRVYYALHWPWLQGYKRTEFKAGQVKYFHFPQ